MSLTKAEIGKIVRTNLCQFTPKSIKAMHPDTRLYPKDAAGSYKVNSSINTLGVSFNNLIEFLLDTEEDLKFRISRFITDGKLNKKDIYNTPIKYHKDTKLHHLIDFIYDEYNKHLNNIVDFLPENIDKKEPTFNKSKNVVVELSIEKPKMVKLEKESFYIIAVKRDSNNLYVGLDFDGKYTLYPKNETQYACIFTTKEIENSFDLDADDIIDTAESSLIKTFLQTLPHPFELSFIKLEEIENDTWEYGVEDKINSILNSSNLSDEDRALIRSRLK